MSTDPKSHAAEIEATINRCVRGTLSTKVAAERIAALQSRAFEDGARDVEVREIVRGLEGVADFLRDDGASPAEERCVRKAASLLAALFLQPEGERNA